jgi:UDP-N-acetylglucosamine 2-epimerase (non-hydrolysing)
MPSPIKKIRIMVVVGTRPEAIKMAPVYLELSSDKRLQVLLCATGQHLELLDTALDDFGLKADFKLNLMKHGQTLGSLTARAISSVNELLMQAKPSAVLVHGDTTTTLAASIAAFYNQIPVGHVEAGLRTGDIHSPFPEELNRQAISRIATWNFAPTTLAVRTLETEGIGSTSIFLTGNTIVDSINTLISNPNSIGRERYLASLKQLLGFDPQSEKTILITTHRRENLHGNIEKIFDATACLATEYPETRFVLPLHPNPKILKAAKVALAKHRNVSLIKPMNYGLFVTLLSNCLCVLTDSGGIQEESVTLGVKVLVLRDATERPEGLESGNLKVIGTSVSSIVEATRIELARESLMRDFKVVSHVYGDGQASQRIHSIVSEALFGKSD